MKNREPPRPEERLSDVTAVAAEGGVEAVTRSETTERILPDFTGFYRSHYREVARALSVTLGNAELGSEAADEAMARCYARWSTVRAYDNPAGWAYRVGLNWARSVLRKVVRATAPPVTRWGDEPEVADPEIHRALLGLSVELRAVVVCRLLFDWSTEETAEVLGIRPGTVKSRLHRALTKLERKLYHLR
jgi:RNA polymerase sigma-70 factor (ECF subfamily)